LKLGLAGRGARARERGSLGGDPFDERSTPPTTLGGAEKPLVEVGRQRMVQAGAARA
jgi:hypothetical protein